MATTITKLSPTGILQSSVAFDEVTSIGGTAIGGSVLFPTSSYLASGTSLTLGVTCTVECWFRTTSDPATSKIVLVAGNGNRGISIYNGVYGQTGYSATKFTVDWETAGNIEFTVPTMSANTWYHLAVTQTALGVMTLWLNGTRSSTGTLTPNWSFISNAYRIGAWSSQSIYSQGVYISNVRITNTAVYDVTQTSITVPTSPLTAFAGTQLLLNMSTSGAAYTDSSNNAITMTATGTPSWSGTITPFTGVSTAIRVSNTGVYAAQFDEVNLAAGTAERKTSTGTYLVSGYFNEVTGMISTNGLAGYWDIGKPESYFPGRTTLVDISGSTKNGTPTGIANITYSSSSTGYLSFTGTSWYDCPLGFTYDTATLVDRTISAWYRCTSTSTQLQGIITIFDGASNTQFEIQLTTAGTSISTSVNQSYSTTGVSVALNTWYNVVATESHTGGIATLYLYLNGVLAATRTYSDVPYSFTADRVRLGCQKNTPRVLLGDIANAQFYTRAITAAEVLNNFEELRSRYGI